MGKLKNELNPWVLDTRRIILVLPDNLSLYNLFMQKTQFRYNNNKPITNNHYKTHITTNLNAQELEKRYGSRLRSRLREMMNVIAFSSNSGDKRQ